MQGEIERLQRLIDDLFTLSHAEADRLTLDLCSVDIAPIVERIVDAVAPLAWEANRVQVVAELPQALPRARVEPSRRSKSWQTCCSTAFATRCRAASSP